MGVTAENVGGKHGMDRGTQDRLAAESHRRVSRAIAKGRFREQIVAVEVKDDKATRSFDKEEHVCANVTTDSLASLNRNCSIPNQLQNRDFTRNV